MGYLRKITQNLPKGLARDFFNYEISEGFVRELLGFIKELSKDLFRYQIPKYYLGGYLGFTYEIQGNI
jgi:hypothetical protein